MKRWKRIGFLSVGILMIVCFVTVLLPALAMEEEENATGVVEEENVIARGEVNDSVTWRVTEDDRGERTLLIGGEGPMADYKNPSEQPWAAWKDKALNLVIEDGVTRIGDYSMYGLNLRKVEIGQDVETIGKHSFAYGSGLTHVVIPGNVKTIEANAFVFHYALASVDLEEGVEAIEHSAFGVQSGIGTVFHIPASVKKIADLAFWTATAYEVDPENTAFCAVDGVLYTKDQTELVDYPKYRTDQEYRIPDSVSVIREGAMQRIVSLHKVYIPSTVQKMQRSFLFRWSGVEEVYVDDGVPLPGEMTFYSCSKLSKVRLPENMPIERFAQIFDYGCNCLESLKIPSGVALIESIGSPLKALSSIEYDAENAVIRDREVLDKEIRYVLTIGEHVDYLPAEFRRFSSQAEKIRFVGPNQLEVEAGAFTEAEEPLHTLEGYLYVDEQGVVYRYDPEAETAQVVYCQSGMTDLVIPAEIWPEEGKRYLVTSVGQDAWKDASDVRTVTFEKPEQIEKIAPYAFAYCQTLVEINGAGTVEQVRKTFSLAQIEIGYRAFYETGLRIQDGTEEPEEEQGYGDLSIVGAGTPDLKISVTSEGSTMEWNADGTEVSTGQYRLLTGDTMTIHAAAGNREGAEEHRYRLYFQWSDRDCSFSIKKGETYTFDGQTATCYETEDPNSMYLEFIPKIGKTLSIPVTVLYPSPVSDGGSLKIWAVILKEEDAKKCEETLISSEKVIKALWCTERDDFALTKTSIGASSLLLKGSENGCIIPSSQLEWRLVLQRASITSSSYGKDYARNVAYEDRLILPEGMSWNREVAAAVQEGRVHISGNYLYAGNQRVAYLGLSGGQLNLYGMSLRWDTKREEMVLSWKVANASKSVQMNTNTISCIFYPEALEADPEVFLREGDAVIQNQVKAEVTYYHSERATLSSAASKKIQIGEGKLELTNQSLEAPYYFGETARYKMTLKNSGALPYQADETGSWIVRNTLSPYTYIPAEEMSRMFGEDEEHCLSIQIQYADLTAWESQQGMYEDTIFWQNSYNSGENTRESADGTVIIGWSEDGSRLEVRTGEKVYCEKSLEDALQKAGYACGRWDEYTVMWKLSSEDQVFSWKAGQTKTFEISARAKDTFQMLSEDWDTYYPTDAVLTLTNTASLLDEEGRAQKNASVNHQVRRECSIGKSVSKEGERLQDDFVAEDGDCLEYTLEFVHSGKGSYENLPIVDDLYGAQALLVRKDKNTHLAEAGLEVYQEDKKEYYVLTEGRYQNVRVGGTSEGKDCIATEIQVEEVREQSVALGEESHSYSGLHTHIEWKSVELPAKTYKMYLSYKAIVRQKLDGGTVYTVGNVVWMNDRKNSRIYSSLWGGGTIIDFYKEIVGSKGQSFRDDQIVEEGYSLVHAGDQVIYRMTLRNKGDGTYLIRGTDLADALPLNGGVFSWEKGTNVTISYQSTHASTQISQLDQWEIADQWEEEAEGGQQYILWPEKTEILFTEADARVDFYVTLTYPTQEEMQWKKYCDAIGGRMLTNTFYVYQFPVNVTHHLGEPGQVLLQKGVYGTSYGTELKYRETQSRTYYNNRDSQNRQVVYYLLLYNGGAKRWYLNEIYDLLPEGCQFVSLVNNSNLNQSANRTYVSTLAEPGEQNLIEAGWNSTEPGKIVYKNAMIRQKDVDKNRISFQISAGEGKEAICYDEELQQFYLNQNEALVFGYLCEIGGAEETEDRMCNTAFMKYTDVPQTGVEILGQDTVSFSGKITEVHGDQNDGSCQLLSGYDMKEQFGIQDGIRQEEWLVSDVSVSRGEIIPGITKYTDSYITSGSVLETEYKNAVGPYDQINWRVRLHNSGTLAMTDYTLQDILPAPYVFCGSIKYTIYDYMGREMQTYNLLSILERTEEQILISNNNSKITVTPNGEMTAIHVSGQGMGQISIDQTEEGEEVLTIHFADAGVSVPEGGYVDLIFSSYNPTNHFKNTVYINQAILKPEVQSFTSVSQGSMTKDEKGQPEGVENSSPVTVSFGYATSSQKAVWENGKEEDPVLSTDPESNYILLSSKDKTFTYQLTVTNDTDQSMEKLILIDALPDVGDTSPFDAKISRNSKFRVDLAEEMEAKVKITTKEGNSYELSREEYELEYSEASSFREQDWDGTASWNGTKENARAIRIRIQDETGEKIPAKAKIEVSFSCRISEKAEPGAIAWNSFGYHYKLLGQDQELEAMPLVVGVKMAEVPVLEKKLIDKNGNPVEAKEEATFSFLLYTGEERETSCKNLEEWISYLEEQQVDYFLQDVTVKAGESTSGAISLDEFSWEEGKTYTVMEIKTDDSYACHSLCGRYTNVYSFVYERDRDIRLTCVNQDKEWTLELNKVDAKDRDHYLEGAIFALYSPSRTVEKAFSIYDTYQPQDIVEHNGLKWYLMDIQTTDADGRILWSHLQESQYLLAELAAPDGYDRREEYVVVYQRNAVSGIVTAEITNEKGVLLPMTGAAGTIGFTVTGLLMSSVGYFISKIRKNRKERKFL